MGQILCTQPYKSQDMCLFAFLPTKQLRQHYTFNHSEIFMLPGNN